MIDLRARMQELTGTGTDEHKELPEILTGRELLARKTVRPKTIIQNLLHKGAKLQVGGPSKTNKTWVLLDLALAAASGGWWMETFQCERSKVLFLNFEIMDHFLEQRIAAVMERRSLQDNEEVMDNVSWWMLRGHASNIETLVGSILDRLRSRDFDLILLDPIYKTYAGLEENSATDMAEFFGHIDRLVKDLNCAVVYSHHFTKGNASAKAAIDRTSGSGVLGRDPDAIVMLTPVELQSSVEDTKDEKDPEPTIEVETIVRDYPKTPKFFVKWEYPVMKKLVLPPGTKIRKTDTQKFTVEKLLEILPNEGLRSTRWKKEAFLVLGMSEGTFDKLRRQAIALERVRLDPKTKVYSRIGV
jgi:RecA-family ATPase